MKPALRAFSKVTGGGREVKIHCQFKKAHKNYQTPLMIKYYIALILITDAQGLGVDP
jgi:hypothetical protein